MCDSNSAYLYLIFVWNIHDVIEHTTIYLNIQKKLKLINCKKGLFATNPASAKPMVILYKLPDHAPMMIKLTVKSVFIWGFSI